jgi:hypothetical protein
MKRAWRYVAGVVLAGALAYVAAVGIGMPGRANASPQDCTPMIYETC